MVAAVLASMNIDLYVVGRRPEEAIRRAQEMSAQFGRTVLPWHVGLEADLFINAAPVTDKPLESAINFLPSLHGCKLVFDHEMPGSKLRDYCAQNNIYHISGYDMYYPQLVAQWNLFLKSFDCEISMEDVKRADAIANIVTV